MDGRANLLMDRKVVGVSGYLSFFLFIYLCIYMSFYLSFYLSLSIRLSFCLSISIYLSVYLSVYRSVCLSLYLYFCLPICLSICLSIFICLSARLPWNLELGSWKPKLFCETSFKFGRWRHQKLSKATSSKNRSRHNIKNEAILRILRDFLQEWAVDCWADSLVPMRFAIFPSHVSNSTAPATKKSGQVIRRAAPVRQNHLGKPEDLSGNQRPDLRKSLMNMFLALRLPREMHLWSSHASHGAETATKPSLTFLHVFAYLWQSAESIAPATQNNGWTSKSGRKSWFRNVLHAATACTHSTSQLPKVLRLWRALHILTSQCASRHNGVHFFNISLSKVVFFWA